MSFSILLCIWWQQPPPKFSIKWRKKGLLPFNYLWWSYPDNDDKIIEFNLYYMICIMYMIFIYRILISYLLCSIIYIGIDDRVYFHYFSTGLWPSFKDLQWRFSIRIYDAWILSKTAFLADKYTYLSSNPGFSADFAKIITTTCLSFDTKQTNDACFKKLSMKVTQL